MNLQAQTVWIETKDQTDSVRFTKGYAGDFTLGREYLEKREGVMPLTVEEIKKIVESAMKKAFYKGFDKCKNDDENCFEAWREEAALIIGNYLNQLIKEV